MFVKKQLDLIKQHHQNAEKGNKNKLEYRTAKLKEVGLKTLTCITMKVKQGTKEKQMLIDS